MQRNLVCVLSDVGGTNARFALLSPEGRAEQISILAVADYPSFQAALSTYLSSLEVAPTALGISVAGPVSAGRVQMTNAAWSICADDLVRELNLAEVLLLNDLEAVAAALPALDDAELIELRPGKAPVGPAPMLAVNVGTGFGAGLVVPIAGDGWQALATEPGHTACDGRSIGVEHETTLEEVISGPAHRRLREAGFPVDDAAWRRSYGSLFGRAVRDLVLSTGAWGGVYLCGGLVADFDRLFGVDAFLDGFAQANPMQDRLGDVPIYRISLEIPAFAGLSSLLQDRARS